MKLKTVIYPFLAAPLMAKYKLIYFLEITTNIACCFYSDEKKTLFTYNPLKPFLNVH